MMTTSLQPVSAGTSPTIVLDRVCIFVLLWVPLQRSFLFFFLMDPAPPEFSPLPLHAALPIWPGRPALPPATGGARDRNRPTNGRSARNGVALRYGHRAPRQSARAKTPEAPPWATQQRGSFLGPSEQRRPAARPQKRRIRPGNGSRLAESAEQSTSICSCRSPHRPHGTTPRPVRECRPASPPRSDATRGLGRSRTSYPDPRSLPQESPGPAENPATLLAS